MIKNLKILRDSLQQISETDTNLRRQIHFYNHRSRENSNSHTCTLLEISIYMGESVFLDKY